jgi:hypothetical protein
MNKKAQKTYIRFPNLILLLQNNDSMADSREGDRTREPSNARTNNQKVDAQHGLFWCVLAIYIIHQIEREVVSEHSPRWPWWVGEGVVRVTRLITDKLTQKSGNVIADVRRYGSVGPRAPFGKRRKRITQCRALHCR